MARSISRLTAGLFSELALAISTTLSWTRMA
jgi:hypothetical protein